MRGLYPKKLLDAQRKGAFLVSDFGGHCAGCGAGEEPFSGAADTAQDAAASSDELRLADFAQRLKVFGGNGGFGLGRRRIWQRRCGLQNDGGRQGNLAREFADNLRRCQDRVFLGRQGSESLRELIVAVVLPRVGRGEELFCGGQFGG